MSIRFNNTECSLSSLDLFSGKHVQRDGEEGIWEKFSPLSTIQNGVVEFRIDGTKSFIDLQNTFIFVKARVVNTDGTNLAADKEVSVINYISGSLWKTVTVKLNGDPLISCSDYNYRAYIETLLNYSQPTKNHGFNAVCIIRIPIPNSIIWMILILDLNFERDIFLKVSK